MDFVNLNGFVYATITTPGPLRPGYAESDVCIGCVQLSPNSGGEGSLGAVGSGLGGVFGVNGCGSDGNAHFECYGAGQLIPVELGQPIAFVAGAIIDIPDCLSPPACAHFPISGFASIGYTVQFFEADGVTPAVVDGLATAEPDSLALAGLGLLGLILPRMWPRRF
jgi:hypothetical protein